ncbi:sugar phosphate isomerase/epimerase [Rhodococcus sp. T2V]|uniref:sugar phosphate isomerase/epimerase family protein n=1 Tax=Rhodococcus sp. T2V TaxID=3034164 RepID=UPI0023E20D12|nr:sugar phosphate isomerase/epimerase family protein [Rhodococcus sp. T2V]MDF3310625.1 sugar phosphate isomerase/epimerase [Rhodococcus sp. T2V]
MTVNTELLASCWTSAGATGPSIGTEMSPVPLRERIEAAGRTGWSGFGLFHKDLIEARQTFGLSTLGAILRDNGMKHVEFEFLTDWWAAGAARAESDRIRNHMFECAGELGVQTIKVSSDLSPTPRPSDQYIEHFALLARDAERHGVRVALEFMPMAHPRTVREAADIVRKAGERAGGLCIDIWHVNRAGTSYEEMTAAVDPDMVFVVELNDAASAPDGTLWEDTVNSRRYCGEGDFDVPRFVAAILSTGYRGHWGVEIISASHRRTPVEDGLRLAHDAAIRSLEDTHDLTRIGGAATP